MADNISSPARRATTKPRGWYRDCCYDHPGLCTQEAASFTGGKSKKPKVYCKPCFEKLVVQYLELDQKCVAAGTLQVARTAEMIRSATGPIWGQTSSACTWIVGQPDTIKNHLKNCLEWDETVRNRAAMEASAPAPPKRQHMDAFPPDPPNMQLATQQIFAPYPLPAAASSSFLPPLSSLLSTNALPGPSRLGTPYPPTEPPLSSAPSSTNPSVPPSLQFYPDQLPSLPPSAAPSPLLVGSQPPNKRQWLGVSGRSSHIVSASGSIPPSPALPPPIWSSAHQEQFEQRLIRLTASAGFPLVWVDNPEFHALVAEFVNPAASIPTRHSLGGRILKKSLERARNARNNRIMQEANRNGTIQFDGWTGMNSRHYNAFMVALGADQLHVLDVTDCSTSRKTGENLFHILIRVVKKAKNELHIEVIAVCSDAGPDPAKARWLIVKEYTEMISLDCYGHQINLLVGTYFKIAGVWFLDYTKLADELIAWLRSKMQLVAVLKVTYTAMTSRPGLSVLRAVLTRWTAHYLAYSRLLELRHPLVAVVDNDPGKPAKDQCVIIGDTKAKGKAQSMVRLIKDREFWRALKKIIRHLRPLAIAANISQAAHIRLDQILLMFGYLFLRFGHFREADEAVMRETMLRAIELRWKRADQDVFIAAVILNPFHKMEPFANHPSLTNAGVYNLLDRLWKRFYKTSTPRDLWSNLCDYLDEKGPYTGMKTMLNMIRLEAHEQKVKLDLFRAWKSFTFSKGMTERPIEKLAHHLLSVCANSASCEQLFSTFGQILTKLRNRMGNKLLLSLAELKMHVRDEHACSSDAKERIKRHFGKRAETQNSSAKTTIANPTGQPSSTQPPAEMYSAQGAAASPPSVPSVQQPPSSSNVSAIHTSNTGASCPSAQDHDGDDKNDSNSTPTSGI